MILKRKIISSLIAFGATGFAYGQEEEIEIFDEGSGEEQINFIDDEEMSENSEAETAQSETAGLE